jgi:hypothetical protein
MLPGKRPNHPSNVAELVDADARRKLSVALEEVELGTVVARRYLTKRGKCARCHR